MGINKQIFVTQHKPKKFINFICFWTWNDSKPNGDGSDNLLDLNVLGLNT